ncbi:hypothetical protein N0V93_003700 [Gnomoniopsis smithogilvyi]|uniref:RNA ligase domain-containing protein n=1 Tax=Gnomoniopsis smithogilvyi TaxID=1191159 RepID=A0A9W9D036_9PEZI|nr:hypothetical protein N0V93_003700 [Gnomoniopsis smithogilvyi]
MKTQRKLVTLRTITDVCRLKGARYKGYDVVTIDGGWSVVVFHGAFPRGQLVLFFEIDSFIPATNGRFSWEDSRDMIEFQGIKGFHVRSQMFGKQISQGLVRHITAWPEVKIVMDDLEEEHGNQKAVQIARGMSFEAILGVKKWGIPCGVQGKVLGEVPQFFPRSACERVQNDPTIFTAKHLDTVFQVTENLDGVSMTAYCITKGSKWHHSLPSLPEGSKQETPTTRFGVASAGQDLDERSNDDYWQAAKMTGIPEKLHKIGISNVAVQGELIGSRVNNNSMNFPSDAPPMFIVFQIFEIDRQEYVNAAEVVAWKMPISTLPGFRNPAPKTHSTIPIFG